MSKVYHGTHNTYKIEKYRMPNSAPKRVKRKKTPKEESKSLLEIILSFFGIEVKINVN